MDVSGAATDALMWAFNASIGFDRRLYAADIAGSIAYAGALVRAGLLTAEEREHADRRAGAGARRVRARRLRVRARR